MGNAILDKATNFYDHGNFEGLLKLATTMWPDDISTIPEPGVAEVCRYLFILARRRDDWARMQLWRARAMSAATLNREIDTIAGLILQPFMLLIEKRFYNESRQVLDELLRLIPEDHPRAELFRGRLYNEKRAFSFFKERQFKEARPLYLEAAKYCQSDMRGSLKVRGGAALTGYLALCPHTTPDSVLYISEMEAIFGEAKQQGFPDVRLAAESNLGLMRDGRFDSWFDFETV